MTDKTTAQTTATTPAKRAKKAAVPVNFGALKFGDAPKDAVVGTRVSNWSPAPEVVEAIKQSWDNRSVRAERGGRTTYIGKAKSVTVPNNAVDTVVNTLRKTATHLKLGLAVKTNPKGATQTEIVFAAQTPKQRKDQTSG